MLANKSKNATTVSMTLAPSTAAPCKTAEQLNDDGISYDYFIDALGEAPVDSRGLEMDEVRKEECVQAPVGFGCHRHTIIDASPFFRGALLSSFAEATGRCTLRYNPLVVESMLRFIYTGDLSLMIRSSWCDLIDLVDCAAMLQLTDLLDMATHQLAVQLLALAVAVANEQATTALLFVCFRQALNILTHFCTSEQDSEKKEATDSDDDEKTPSKVESSSSASASSITVSTSASKSGPGRSTPMVKLKQVAFVSVCDHRRCVLRR